MHPPTTHKRGGGKGRWEIYGMDVVNVVSKAIYGRWFVCDVWGGCIDNLMSEDRVRIRLPNAREKLQSLFP